MKAISFRRIARGVAPWLMVLVAAVAMTAQAQPDTNNVVSFDIPAQELSSALIQFSDQTGIQVVTSGYDVVDRNTNGVSGPHSVNEALTILLEGTGLTFQRVAEDTVSLSLPQTGAVAGQNTVGQRRKGIEEIIVTGQKKEERIQDVPIAITAFTQEDLTVRQIAGGPDLHLQVPNMTFTKTNFTGYSIQIRGIGTQAISATTDPAVAVAMNQTPFIRNRFFEQEFYDMERVEVLRGPQGTLFGRNATAGVVNLVTNKPQFQEESMVSLDMGNYNSRRWEFMVNTPLAGDKAAFRFAAAGTKRDGYAVNEVTDNPIDGRDLFSTRASLRFAPSDNLDLTLIWEHFEEDDDRLRSGKQLCSTDEVTEVAGYQTTHFQPLPNAGQSGAIWSGVQATFSQGCKRNSLYDEDSFQTPNGLMLAYYVPLGAIGLPIALDDPYVSRVQSRDLREIESTVDPEYRARSDIGELQIDYQITDALLLESETAYLTDDIFSKQDFNRFSTAPGAWLFEENRRPNLLLDGPQGPDTVFCDPQIGCADRLVAVDVSTAESSQFSQEFRLSSQFGGPFNFSIGANYLRYDTVDKYYVFANSFTLSRVGLFPISPQVEGADEIPWLPGETTNEICLNNSLMPGNPREGNLGCTYIDPNPIGSLNDLGHNYFLSKNPFNLRSYAVFGETYWNVTDELKLTAGLRWSVDKKSAPLHPTWLFVDQSVGHPETGKVVQEWREPTGRLVLDWKPVLGFTDETLVYGSISRGYKAGGANPPLFVPIASRGQARRTASLTRPQTFDAEFVNAFEVGTKNTLLDGAVILNAAAFYYNYKDYQISELVDRSAFNKNYDAEVWGLELEADWWATERLRLSFKGGYQNTRIADGEQAVDLMDRDGDRFPVITETINPNYTGDPGQGRPVSEYEYINSLRDLDQLPADQEFFAFDQWTSIRPFAAYPSSCLIPSFIFDGTDPDRLVGVGALGGSNTGGCEVAYLIGYDPVTGAPYAPNPPGPTDLECGNDLNPSPDFPAPCTLQYYLDNTYPGWDPTTAPNGGEGISKDLGGNELPNAPHYTTTLSADYVIPLNVNWSLTLHTDLYWQSKSWWRIFNDHEYSRLEDYFTMNLAAILKSETGWDIMAYIKNFTNETAITGAFLYTDDVGLTTNLFLVEPRLYGIRATKRWDAGGGPASWLGGAGAALLGKGPGEPSPWSLTLGGQLLRPKDSPNEIVKPTFITEFDPSIDPTGEQAGDMDWGDGREIELTYAPDNGWRFSLGVRFGESNRERRGGDRVLLKGESFEVCVLTLALCQGGELDPEQQEDVYQTRDNYGITEFSESEEHLLLDFMVGREIGLGALESQWSAGLRYAQFKSRADGVIRGTPDWDIPEECWGGSQFQQCNKYAPPATRHEYIGTMDAEREFEGLGPVVAWDASLRLFGDARGGHLDLDASLSGGVLFGKQDTSIKGTEEERYFIQTYADQAAEGDFLPDEFNQTVFDYERDDDSIEAVSTLGAGLGLTYRVEGFSVGAGYSWERYYGVIDGGVAERKAYERTIDGPYLKVTFGAGE